MTWFACLAAATGSPSGTSAGSRWPQYGVGPRPWPTLRLDTPRLEVLQGYKQDDCYFWGRS